LASNGSVVPIFWEQIRHGGPLTVTHPDVRRYLMLISEAVQLVLHAGAIAHSGDILVLRMGNQIKIVDLAQNMIRLAGFIPGEEIPITFVGLRPGEKISEELLANDETGEASGVQDLIRVRSSEKLDHASIQEAAADLVQAACRNDTELVVDLLSRFQRSAPASSLRKT
jgi:FlaA1/EpsC-like NDP-sugar epimerase